MSHFISLTNSMKQRYSLFNLLGSTIVIDTHVHNIQNVEMFFLTPKEMGSHHQFYFNMFVTWKLNKNP
jgi:hypothetical protein